jgi:hypothetical protein
LIVRESNASEWLTSIGETLKLREPTIFQEKKKTHTTPYFLAIGIQRSNSSLCAARNAFHSLGDDEICVKAHPGEGPLLNLNLRELSAKTVEIHT